MEYVFHFYFHFLLKCFFNHDIQVSQRKSWAYLKAVMDITDKSYP